MNKWIYHFRTGSAEGSNSMGKLLGGKGAGLAEISNLGFAVPPGFTISTEICEYYYKHNSTLPPSFDDEINQAIKILEQNSGKILGCSENPLLLSVRSGARTSMPGMMDTILNIGINNDIAKTLYVRSGNSNFAYDSYRRLIEMYGTTVLNIPRHLFDDSFELNIIQGEDQRELSLKVIEDYKKIIEKYTGFKFPEDPYTQLKTAIEAVLKSWMSERAIAYRIINGISDDSGTAVNIQSMVFGNMGETSATGVVFTRNPSDGAKEIFGEFLVNAQGEDIVSGLRTPLPITSCDSETDSMQLKMPTLFNELKDVCLRLELYFKDVQDIEFTIEQGQLYILQTRNAKRTTAAAIKIAVDHVNENLISKNDAIMRIQPESLNQLLHARIDYSKELQTLTQGLPASPGAATGIVAFSPYDAEEMSHHHKVILVRNDTSPDDIKGMHVSCGILTSRGGMTSHAAVVARGMGKPCVCGVSAITVYENENIFKIGNIIVRKGDEITIDGSTGKVFLGKAPLIQPEFSREFDIILSYADEIRSLAVRANAETLIDTINALKFGAEGIGLCRTEHMFFDAEKIPLVREMIIASDSERRLKAINKLLPLQTRDFKEIFKILKGAPINVRLLDPPLHEFLPLIDEDIEALALNLNISISSIRSRLNALHEVNPMLGHRGCRLGITYPEIYQMQVSAIISAMNTLKDEEGIDTNLELMIPLVSNQNELIKIKQEISKLIKDQAQFRIGTMIELPRAALTSDKIAKEVDFFSFGTNDLTQTTYGISRDDIASFLPTYLDKKVFNHDPFVQIDEEGVGELIKISSERGKKTNPNLKLGVCGEHAGNPTSIDFFHKIGLDYISCSPYRIPIARLAAAQAKIKTGTT